MEIANTQKTAKLSAKVNYNGFAVAFRNLPIHAGLIIRKELQKRLHWSIASFYYKRSGESPIRENEFPIIEEIFNRHGLNPWTGEKL
jgi:hypothetical protein